MEKTSEAWQYSRPRVLGGWSRVALGEEARRACMSDVFQDSSDRTGGWNGHGRGKVNGVAVC